MITILALVHTVHRIENEGGTGRGRAGLQEPDSEIVENLKHPGDSESFKFNDSGGSAV